MNKNGISLLKPYSTVRKTLYGLIHFILILIVTEYSCYLKFVVFRSLFLLSCSSSTRERALFVGSRDQNLPLEPIIYIMTIFGDIP